MSDDLQRGIVRIIAVDGSTLGTGFIVSSDGLIATCAHVLEAEPAYVNQSAPVRIVFHASGEERAAQIMPQWFRPSTAQDVAILSLQGKDSKHQTSPLSDQVRVLPLGATIGRLDNINPKSPPIFSTFGFPRAKPVDGLAGRIDVVGATKDNGYHVFSVRTSEMSYGFSGGPVWDDELRSVVGMNVSIIEPGFDRGGRQRDTAFFTPVETLRDVCPELALKDGKPYRSLDVFEEEHAPFFWGRDRLIARLISTLQQEHLILVVGVSGSGKSSLMRAGLTRGFAQSPALQLSKLPRRVFRAGANALLNLIVALQGPHGEDGQRVAEIFDLPLEANGPRTKTQERLQGKDTGFLIGALKQFVTSSPLILVCDQFERLFTEATGGDDAAARQRFVRVLTEAAGPNLKVIMTVRADYYGRTIEFPMPARAAERAQVNITPMNADELHEAIERPAAMLFRNFQPGLVETMVNDVIERPGDLPLLQFALTELWDADHAGGLLTRSSYERLGRDTDDPTGAATQPGVRGVIIRRAEQYYRGLTDVERQICEEIFLDLVIAPPAGPSVASVRDISRRAPQNQIPPEAQDLARRMSESFLITASVDPLTNEPTIEVAHEALIRSWPRLREWVTRNKLFTLWYQSEFAHGFDKWMRSIHARTNLERSAAVLTDMKKWRTKYPRKFTGDMGVYVDRSLRSARHRRLALTGSIAVIAIAGLLTAFLYQRLSATQQNARVVSARDSFEQGMLALQNAEILEAEAAFSHALTLDDRRQTRERLIEVRAHGVQRGPVLHLPTNQVSRVIGISPNTGYAALRSNNGKSLLIWDTKLDQQYLTQFPALTSQDCRAAFSPNNDWFACAEIPDPAEKRQDGALRLCHLRTRREWTFPADDRPVSAVAFNDDNTVLAYASERGTIWLLSLRPPSTQSATDAWRPTPVAMLPGQQHAIWGLAFSHDGRHLASCGSNVELRLWDWPQHSSVPLKGHTDTVYSVAFSPDGGVLASGGADSTVRFWNVKSPDSPFAVIEGDFGQVNDLVYSSDGRFLAGACEDKTVRVWGSSTKREQLRVHAKDACQHVAFDVSNRMILAGGDGASPQQWNIAADNVTTELANATASAGEHPISSVVFEPASPPTWLAAGGHDGHIRFWNWPARTLAADLPVSSGRVLCLAVNPMRPLLAWAGDEPAVHLIDTKFLHETGKFTVSEMNPNDQIWGLCFSADGRSLACGTYIARTVHLWDMDSPSNETVLPANTGAVWNVAFGADRSTIAMAGGDKSVRVWNLPTTQPTIFNGHTGEVWALAFSPDHAHLASGAADSLVEIWTLSDPTASRLLHGHTGLINSLAYSPDGKWLVSASVDSTLRLWPCHNGDVIHDAEVTAVTLRKTAGPLWWVSISRDSHWIAAAGLSGRLAIWDLDEISRLLTAPPANLARETQIRVGP